MRNIDWNLINGHLGMMDITPLYLAMSVLMRYSEFGSSYSCHVIMT